MAYRRVPVLEAVIFAAILAGWWDVLSRSGFDVSGVYLIGWPLATLVFSVGGAALAASASGSCVRALFESGASERRAARRLAARPPLPAWIELDEPLRNLARHAHMVLDELSRGLPLEGQALEQVARWRDHVASLGDTGRYALAQRGIDVTGLPARLDVVMVQDRGDPGSDLDRMLCTFLIAAATEVRSVPYR